MKLWPQEILRQTRLIESTTFAGTIEKEILFWQEMEYKLNQTKEQLNDTCILLTKLILKRTNRVSEQLIYEAENQLDKVIKVISISLLFCKDFPIDELNNCMILVPNLSKIMIQCLQHFSKLKHSQYDYHRSIKFIENLSNNILTKIVFILKQQHIMSCSLQELIKIKYNIDNIIITWTNHFSIQKNILKDVAKRRGEKMIIFKFEFETLQYRLKTIAEFREQHEKLLNILTLVLSNNNNNINNIGSNSRSNINNDNEYINLLIDGYQEVVRTNIDIYDLSSTGTNIWNNSIQTYEKKIEKLDQYIIKILDEKLNKAKNADEMFEIFSTFNPLFFRPIIRNAVNTFRTILMKNVKDDVIKLQNKFKLRYDESNECIIAELRDVPPLSGRIIWAKQIENQLNLLMARIKNVLGHGWEEHNEGKKLKEVCDELNNYLDTQVIYDEWLQTQLRYDSSSNAINNSNSSAASTTNSGRYNKSLKDLLLLIDHDPRTLQKYLYVNFDETQIIIYKEVKYLEWLLPSMSVAHKTIPSSIKSKANEAYVRYPIAIALQSILSIFHQSKLKLTSSNSLLLFTHIKSVREIINEAIGGSKRSRWIKWDTTDLNEWINILSNKVYTLQERVDEINEKLFIIQQHLMELSSCSYDYNIMNTNIQQIQSIVDELSMRGLSNIAIWTKQIDRQIEDIIKNRLEIAINQWVSVFKHKMYDDTTTITTSSSSLAAAAIQTTTKGISDNDLLSKQSLPSSSNLILKPMIHEILLSNQVLFVNPPLEQSRIYWIHTLQTFISIAMKLPRIQSSRYQVFAKTDTNSPKDYHSIIYNIDSNILKYAYHSIEEEIYNAKVYLNQWLQYQTLWDANVNNLVEIMNNNIEQWYELLHNIKVIRLDSIDNSIEERRFGSIIINHHQVQNKINMKYDTWQKDIQIKFSYILIIEIKQLYHELISNKTKLELIILDNNQTQDIIIGIEFILTIKNNLGKYNNSIQNFKKSEKLLLQQRFQFTNDWIQVSLLISTFQDMNDILERKIIIMNQELPNLQIKLQKEDQLLQSRKDKFIEYWHIQKPTEGNLNPTEVLQNLSLISNQILKIIDDNNRIKNAKIALQMNANYDNDYDYLYQLQSEINDLNDVWLSVSPIHEKINVIRATLYNDIIPVKIRQFLDEITIEIKKLPMKIRSYAAVEYLMDLISKYLSYQVILRDLCTESLKERHWKIILQKLNLQSSDSSSSSLSSYTLLTLGQIWLCNPLLHVKFIQEILSTATGELALEQFLSTIRQQWINFELIIIIRDGIKIISGWDILFITLEDNLNSISSMKSSPYYRNVHEFQEESINWEQKLTNLRIIFEIWVEVQRKWLYLRNIFKNNDIKQQLQSQYSKFKSIDNEYLNILKRCIAKPSVLELLQYENLHRQLERQDNTMTLIQKALGMIVTMMLMMMIIIIIDIIIMFYLVCVAMYFNHISDETLSIYLSLSSITSIYLYTYIYNINIYPSI